MAALETLGILMVFSKSVTALLIVIPCGEIAVSIEIGRYTLR